MPRYHVDNRFTLTQQSLTSSFKTLTAVYNTSGSLRRGRIVSIAVGADGAPSTTDSQIVYAVQRQTATGGTNNAATPSPLDPANQAAVVVSKINYTAEGTYSTIVWSRALNQRASMQWTAPDTDASLYWAATVDLGLVLLAMSPTGSGYANAALGGIEYEE